MTTSTLSPIPRRCLHTALDVLLGALAIALGVAVQIFVVLRVLRVPVWQVKLAGDPRVWLSTFLEPIVTLPVLTLVLRWRGQTWSDLGLRKPKSVEVFLKHVGAGIVLMLGAAYAIRTLIIEPLHLHSRGFPALQGNEPAFTGLMIYVLLGVGLNEELQFRGFLQNSFTRMLGSSVKGRYASAIITGLIFGIAHSHYGAGTVVYAGLLGALLGSIYLWADGNLWVPVVLHSLFDAFRAIQFFLYGNDLPS